MPVAEPHRQPTPIKPDRLESWKEIAAYLNRTIRTVQRWEKLEGLPVRRLDHAKQGSVYAFRSELDVWTAEHQRGLEQKEAVQPVLRRAWWKAIALVPLAGVMAWAIYTLLPRPPR